MPLIGVVFVGLPFYDLHVAYWFWRVSNIQSCIISGNFGSIASDVSHFRGCVQPSIYSFSVEYSRKFLVAGVASFTSWHCLPCLLILCPEKYIAKVPLHNLTDFLYPTITAISAIMTIMIKMLFLLIVAANLALSSPLAPGEVKLTPLAHSPKVRAVPMYVYKYFHSSSQLFPLSIHFRTS